MNHPLATLFEQFLKERTYLKNVTRSSLVWYQVAFRNYAAAKKSKNRLRGVGSRTGLGVAAVAHD